MKLVGSSRVIFFAWTVLAALVSLVSLAGALTTEQSLDLLASKSQAELNSYFATDKIVFAKQADFTYGTTFSYTASYRITNDQWRADFFINAQKDLGLLKKGAAVNGFNVQLNDDPSRLIFAFYCDDPLRSGVSYLVYSELAQQNVSFTGVASAFTSACLEFQDAVLQSNASLEPSVLAPQSSYVPSSCVLQGEECCRGALCKKAVQISCLEGQAPKITGCDVTCTPRVVCAVIPSIEPSATPYGESPAPTQTLASTAPSASSALPSTFEATTIAPTAAPQNPQFNGLSLLPWGLAGAVIAAAFYWFFFRDKAAAAAHSDKKK